MAMTFNDGVILDMVADTIRERGVAFETDLLDKHITEEELNRLVNMSKLRVRKNRAMAVYYTVA